jgi:CCR4-NOT transcription complex subunit 4
MSKKGMNQKRGPLPERAKFKDYRVVQRELVYIIGIPLEIASEAILSKYEYFGQYGAIKKIYVNTSNVHANASSRATVSAFVTYYNKIDALETIYALENFYYNGFQIKPSLGTSKYCTLFLYGQKCNKTDCMYLHHLGEEGDSFSPEEIAQTSERFISTTRPSRPPDYLKCQFQDSIPTVFPPRRMPGKENYTGPAEEEEEFDEEEVLSETEEEQLQEPLTLAKILLKPIVLATPPLQVNYTTDDSLMRQLDLDRPSVRTIMKSKI